jgi:hypothetical protein
VNPGHAARHLYNYIASATVSVNGVAAGRVAGNLDGDVASSSPGGHAQVCSMVWQNQAHVTATRVRGHVAGSRNHGCPTAAPFNVSVALPCSVVNDCIGLPCFWKYSGPPLANSCSFCESWSILRLPVPMLMSIPAPVAPSRCADSSSTSSRTSYRQRGTCRVRPHALPDERCTYDVEALAVTRFVSVEGRSDSGDVLHDRR